LELEEEIKKRILAEKELRRLATPIHLREFIIGDTFLNWWRMK
jgi:hypothetical protein